MVTLTHVGGPTVLIEAEGWRIISDPTFDPAGGTYGFGFGTHSRKLADPAIAADAIGHIDVALLSHDHHADNLDDAGRQLLHRAAAVVTTRPGSKRLGHGAIGMAEGEVRVLSGPGRPDLEIRATPCRHGPIGSRPIAGAVVGFALRWTRSERVDLWITGDTVMHRKLKRAARAMTVSVAIVHLGEVRFRSTGRVAYSLTAERGFELARMADALHVVPVHYEGWSHFHESQDSMAAAIERLPPAERSRVRRLDLGAAADLAATAPQAPPG